MSYLFTTAAPVSEVSNGVLMQNGGEYTMQAGAGRGRVGCVAMTKSDVDTMRRHKCFMAADGNTVCANDVNNGQNMIVDKRL